MAIFSSSEDDEDDDCVLGARIQYYYQRNKNSQYQIAQIKLKTTKKLIDLL